jgi:hypothetical protein
MGMVGWSGEQCMGVQYSDSSRTLFCLGIAGKVNPTGMEIGCIWSERPFFMMSKQLGSGTHTVELYLGNRSDAQEGHELLIWAKQGKRSTIEAAVVELQRFADLQREKLESGLLIPIPRLESSKENPISPRRFSIQRLDERDQFHLIFDGSPLSFGRTDSENR